MKALFHGLAQVSTLQRLASKHGVRRGGFAHRFSAGETVDEAIEAVADVPANVGFVVRGLLSDR